MEQSLYNVYKIIYTDIRGKRANAFIAEESSEEALDVLEETLINFNYSNKDIEKMIPIVKITGETSLTDWIKFL